MNKRENWLSQLENSLPEKAKGNDLSTYSIALEGWRRGLTLKFYGVYIKAGRYKIRYSLNDGIKEHHFTNSKGDFITKEQGDICKSKSLTNKYLLEAGVPIPQGRHFNVSATENEILDYSLSIGFPLVLKPANESLGRGVVLNIKNVDDLKEALFYVREKSGYKEVILQQYIKGNEYRVYVIGNEVVGVYKRKAANVIGDGMRTIKKLIEIKNIERKENPHLYKRLIAIDDKMIKFLSDKGKTIESIPKKGEEVILREIGNLPNGGDSVDFTDSLSEENKNIAIDGAKAVGMAHCGLDMIIDENNQGKIIEINTRAHIGAHLFPVHGIARDIPGKIIDLYFPNSK
ncbi:MULTISPECIES: ATP-grasp domain-containing protein [Bacillaceae]|uniref:ATP-grasp domain-containing protein n=1 Tax=Evansella alkalicola TaxID=745819 RepID=A0ABS6JW49_9BACI|nr:MULTISPECIES: ATP-grasp domain-containing protein [Bacillaceae]MBU9722718.1 ATP-grasp domain-containing protein [Bacillus alkalicola]